MRLKTLSSDPTLRNFAQDTSQANIQRVAKILSPTVEVPDVTGKYKIYDAKHRYKRPKTRRSHDGRATRIGFTADDATYSLEPNALDFPIPNAERLSGPQLLHQAQYGATLLAESAGLAHEGEVIDKALAAAGPGTDYNVKANDADVVERFDLEIAGMIKKVKNGAPVKILMGTTAWLRIKNAASVKERILGNSKKSFATIKLEEFGGLLFGNPTVDLSLLVEDDAAEGLNENIEWLLDTAVLIFASKDNPTTMDPSFMKTFRLAGNWMVPGSYMSEDGRDEILKYDWYEQIAVTNSQAITRLNITVA